MQFRLIGLAIGFFYILATGAVLYLDKFAFSILLQAASLFILTSGYLIPTLLRISQLKLEAGLRHVDDQNKRESLQEEANLANDLSLDKQDVGSPEEDKGKIRDNYFTQFYGEKKEKESGKKKNRNVRRLILPYTALFCCAACYVVIMLNPVRFLFDKDNDF